MDLAGVLHDIGVEVSDLPDDSLVSDAIVLLKYVEPDGTVGMRVAFGPGSSWLERIGMLRTAVIAEEADVTN